MRIRPPTDTPTAGHESVGAGAVVIGTQVPSRPGRLQVSSGPSHGVSQQTPSTQFMDWHCDGLLQGSPLSRSGVLVGVAVTVPLAVAVAVPVLEAVRVCVGGGGGFVDVAVDVDVWVVDGLRLGVSVAVPVRVGVVVGVAVTVAVAVPKGTPRSPARTSKTVGQLSQMSTELVTMPVVGSSVSSWSVSRAEAYSLSLSP